MVKKQRPAQEQKRQPGHSHVMEPKPQYDRESYRGTEKLKGKVALISGGDSGIGRSVAQLFAKEGADIAIIYLEEDRDAKETQKLVETQGQKCLLLPGDIQKREFCTQAVESTLKEFGQLNILINNAAEQHPTTEFTDITPEQLHNTFATNFFGYFYLTQAALPHLNDGDSIINTTSVTAYRGSHHLIDYSATKGAIVAFTRSLSKLLAPKNIRVNGVAPGPIWTPLIPASFPADQVATFGSDVPLGRAGQPVEVATAYVYLASEDGSYTTGQVLHPNGGEMVGS